MQCYPRDNRTLQPSEDKTLWHRPKWWYGDSLKEGRGIVIWRRRPWETEQRRPWETEEGDREGVEWRGWGWRCLFQGPPSPAWTGARPAPVPALMPGIWRMVSYLSVICELSVCIAWLLSSCHLLQLAALSLTDQTLPLKPCENIWTWFWSRTRN